MADDPAIEAVQAARPVRLPSRRWHVRITRDLVLFITGIAGFAHEMLVAREPREILVIACMSMCGLPFFLRLDERNK